MTSISRSALPLSGVRVVDFGQYIAGPAVAMILGDLGATVVHVDPPGGPMWDNPANAILNRNKLIVTIDLKTAHGLEEARALIAGADVVIENFRPGVMARLGLDFEALRTVRPELITLSIPGFGSNDQLRRDWRAFETVIAASSGVFTDMGLNRVLMGINPSFSPLPLASAYGTMLAASATVLALQARERTGHGDHIEVPLASAVMEGSPTTRSRSTTIRCATRPNASERSSGGSAKACRWTCPTRTSSSFWIPSIAATCAAMGACSTSSAPATGIMQSAACRPWASTMSSPPRVFAKRKTLTCRFRSGLRMSRWAFTPCRNTGPTKSRLG